LAASERGLDLFPHQHLSFFDTIGKLSQASKVNKNHYESLAQGSFAAFQTSGPEKALRPRCRPLHRPD
jgi:hypothetical protein